MNAAKNIKVIELFIYVAWDAFAATDSRRHRFVNENFEKCILGAILAVRFVCLCTASLFVARVIHSFVSSSRDIESRPFSGATIIFLILYGICIASADHWSSSTSYIKANCTFRFWEEKRRCSLEYKHIQTHANIVIWLNVRRTLSERWRTTSNGIIHELTHVHVRDEAIARCFQSFKEINRWRWCCHSFAGRSEWAQGAMSHCIRWRMTFRNSFHWSRLSPQFNCFWFGSGLRHRYRRRRHRDRPRCRAIYIRN